MYTPLNPRFTIYKCGVRGSKLCKYVFVMSSQLRRIVSTDDIECSSCQYIVQYQRIVLTLHVSGLHCFTCLLHVFQVAILLESILIRTVGSHCALTTVHCDMADQVQIHVLNPTLIL